MSTSASARPVVRKGFESRGPYVFFAVLWWAFLMLAFRVPLIEPVFWWALTQGLIAEALFAGAGFWGTRLLLLGAYSLAGLLAWAIVERPRKRSGAWIRAALSWIVLQLLYAATAFLLVEAGILYE